MKKNLRTPKFVAYKSKGSKENILRKCLICDLGLTRKRTRRGKYEEWSSFLKRKTCGLLKNGKKSECLKLLITGQGNPKWRGGLPICKKCGKRTAWYSSKNKRNPQNYCKPCFNIILAVISKKNGKARRGIYPENLKPYRWKKGMRPKNKLYEDYTQCEISGCIRKPIARYVCGKHYQQKYK